MARARKGSRAGVSVGLGASSSSYILDPLLLPRLQQYAYNNDISSLDATVEYLRTHYREYQRKQMAPFRRLVLNAITLVKQQQSAFDPPLRAKSSRADDKLLIQARGVRVSAPNSEASCKEDLPEGSHGGFGEGEDGGEDDLEQKKSVKGGAVSSRSRALSDSSGSEADLVVDWTETERPSFNLLNSSLRATYNGRPALVIDNTPSGRSAFAVKDQTFAVVTSPMSNPKETIEDTKPAMDSESREVQADSRPPFAPPNVIEATLKAAFSAGKKSHKRKTSEEDTKVEGLSVPTSAEKNPFKIFPPAQFSGRLQPVSYPHASSLSDKATPIIFDETKNDGIALSTGSGLVIDSQETRQTLAKTKNSRMDNIGVEGESDRSRSSKKGRWVVRKEKENMASETGDKFSSWVVGPPEKIRFKDLGGIQETIGQILEVIYPLYHPQVYPWLGLQPMRGLLLHGPPGCGKTKLANAIAFETKLPFLRISAPEVVSGMSGESEAKVRSLFQEALRMAPSIIFIDEIDVISTKRESAQREMERRLVTQLMTCMDELNHSLPEDENQGGSKMGHVLVIGATNRPEALDPALRRPGRFDREIELSVPNENARIQILSVLSRTLRLEGSFDFGEIAKCTPGFVGADLAALTKEAASVAIKRILAVRGQDSSSLEDDDPWWERPWTEEELKTLSITMGDFKEAVTKVQPSTKREGFSSVPGVTWEDVGSLDCIRKELDFFIARRIKHPEDYEALQMDMDSGFLLYGPPGCGKTLVAKAVANATGANFIYIKGPELLNKYVGESERAVRQLFSRARTCAPCVLFFDEIDAMAPRRGSDGNAAAERVVNQLLIEMDGLEQRKGIFLLAATNRPDMIDPAMLRPGRLGKLLYVPLPNAHGRVSILRTLTRQKPLDSDTDLESIGHNEHCNGFSGADLAALVNEACVAAIRERSLGVEATTGSNDFSNPLVICHRHFEEAFTKVHPSVASKEVLHYKEMPQRFSCTQVHKRKRLLKAEGQLPLE